MKILSIALGGCICARPQYGITQDTGGHIAYVLGEMAALARRSDVASAEIVTRLFDDPLLGPIHSQPCEQIAPKLSITRINSGDTRYLAKEALETDRAAFTQALIKDLSGRCTLPDIIHAHFADAAEVADEIRRVLGIPFVYTAHSLGLDKAATMTGIDDALRRRIDQEAAAIANAAAVIGSSRDECERQLVAYPGAQIGKIHRITPGTHRLLRDHTTKAEALIAPFLREPGRPIVLAIARPVWKKNLAALIDAFGGDAQLRNMANLVIVAGQRGQSEESDGEHGDVFREMLERIDRHDLYGSIAYPKRHDEEDIAGLYQLAAASRGAFVNPALIEPYGLTIVEAASYGVPVVATRNGGTVDTVSELAHGVLIDPRSPREIAGAVRHLLTDNAYWDRCAANGAKNARSHTWAAYAAQFVKIASHLTAPAIARAPALVRAEPPRHLLACDLDNTLTGCADGVASFRAMLERRPDITFVIATGRSLVEARRIMRQWDLPDPAVWITDVGTRIYWPTSGVPVRDETYLRDVSDEWRPAVIRSAAAPIAGLSLQPHYDQNAFKCSWFFKDPASVQMLRRSLDVAGYRARVIASHGHLLDVLPSQAGKGAAVLHVASRLGIPRPRIIAAGDSGNDIDMLRVAAHPVIVANHSSELAHWSSEHRGHCAKRAHAHGVVEGTEAYLLRLGGPVAPASAWTSSDAGPKEIAA
ncbi:HAD-IIB family hydrolase [Erythrobacter sp. R86502]|uniref:HAD-IIB family hydrolase n=1 Tax=Erythrobacter sp. R86502 TaxID=3093846 RepID=UPI0036D26B6A